MSFMVNPNVFAAMYPGASTITFVGAAAAGYGITATSLDLTTLTGGSASAADSGDLVIFITSRVSGSGGDPGNPSMSTSGYDPLVAALSSQDTLWTKVAIFSKFMGDTPDTSAVAAGSSGSSQSGTSIALVYRGVHASITDATSTSATGIDSSQANPPSITPSTSGARIIAVAAGSASAIYTGFTGMSNFIAAANGGSISSAAADASWTSGAYDPPTVSGGGSAATHSWIGITLALKPTNITTPPVFTVAPSITSANGFYGDGDTLTGTPGTHNGYNKGYQWYRDGVAISGATSVSYTLVTADVGHLITFGHKASNYLGTTIQQSSTVGPIVTPTFTTDPLIPSGDMQSGSDVFLTSGDMQSGTDALLYIERTA